MSSIPFRDAIIFRFPAVRCSVLPMKSFFPHRWLCGVERIRSKSRISRYYSHFIPRFVLFFFVSFSLWPSSSDRFVWWKIFPFIFPLRLVCINSCPLGFCFFAFAFRIGNGLTGSSDPGQPSRLVTLLNSNESWSAPVSSPQITVTELEGHGTHRHLWHSSYCKVWPVLICM